MSVKEISVLELKNLLTAQAPIQLIDCREPAEKEIADIGGELIPLATIPQSLEKFSKDKPIVVYCRSGGRSLQACQYLVKTAGFKDVTNVRGGILAWADAIDQSITKY